MKLHYYLILLAAAMLVACDARVDVKPDGADRTTIVTPPAEKKVENTTIVTPPAEKK